MQFYLLARNIACVVLCSFDLRGAESLQSHTMVIVTGSTYF